MEAGFGRRPTLELPSDREAHAEVVRLVLVGRRAVVAVEPVEAPVEVAQELLAPGTLQLQTDALSAADVRVRHETAGDVEVFVPRREEIQGAADGRFRRVVRLLPGELFVRVDHAGKRGPLAVVGLHDVAAEASAGDGAQLERELVVLLKLSERRSKPPVGLSSDSGQGERVPQLAVSVFSRGELRRERYRELVPWAAIRGRGIQREMRFDVRLREAEAGIDASVHAAPDARPDGSQPDD